MSIFGTILRPIIEKELKSIEPQIALFLVTQLKNVAHDVIDWAENKVKIDLNGDGKIGSSKHEA